MEANLNEWTDESRRLVSRLMSVRIGHVTYAAIVALAFICIEITCLTLEQW